MTKTIKRVNQTKEIETVAGLARQIWTEHYVPVIGRRQVEYMLEKFQSVPAIKSQIEKGYEYYLLLVDGKPAGYLALVGEQKENRLMISKIYVLRAHRGKGCGTYLLNHVRKRAKKLDIGRIWLRVNKYNDDTINWYKQKGFEIKEEDRKEVKSQMLCKFALLKIRVKFN
ncbi:MAG: GNAT family N-acetyltransferase [bacterium]